MIAALIITIGCGKRVPPPAPAAPPPIVIRPAEPPKPVVTTVTISASPDTNPDASGRPSPIVVRVYQLKAEAAFAATEFFPLFDDEQKALGPELVGREEVMVAPAEQRHLDLTMSADARFVGIAAAFRDIRNSEWRLIAPAPHRGVTVKVERARVTLSPAQ